MREGLKFGDFLVVIPGLGGSVLSSPGGPLWEPSRRLAGSLLKDRHDVLERLGGDPEKLDDPEHDDGVVATGLIRSPVAIPGLASTNQYRSLTAALTGSFELVRGDPLVDGPPANYFEFAYDWRRDNRISAARLKELVDRELPKWRSVLPYGEPRTVLVCHSMGGLVAKYYLDVLGGWRHCRALVTFGTPFRGAPKALNVLANGFTACGAEIGAVSALLRRFTSVHQLLPRYPMVRDEHGQVRRVHEFDTDLGELKISRAQAAYQDFHRALGTPERYRSRLRPLIGYGHRTAQSAVVRGGTVLVGDQVVTDNASLRAMNTGDGTVPEVSAMPVELTDSPWWWHNGKHSSMHTKKDVLDNLVRTLTPFTDLGDLQNPGSADQGAPRPDRAALDVRLAEVHAQGDPVAVDCVLDDPAVTDPPSLTTSENVTVERTETSEGHRFMLRGLPVGAHEVTVDWAGCSVTDVFEVC
ncbi:hypothetical protein PV646_39325 [Streptomyces sp. ID05-26A]|nr:hypothetical protein [Streptomyces sp. ID05-26A]